MFVHTTMSTAKGLTDRVSKSLVDHGLDLCEVRGVLVAATGVNHAKTFSSEMNCN